MKMLLFIHAAAGTLALVIAPLAMLASKGSDAHRRWGKVFFYAMSVVVVTAIIAGIVRPNILMALVALFSFHMLASGYRALYLKKLHEGQRMQRWDYILQGSAAVINGALFLWELINLTMGRRDSASIIFFIFGSVGLFMVWRNVHQFFKRSVDKREWLYNAHDGFPGGLHRHGVRLQCREPSHDPTHLAPMALAHHHRLPADRLLDQPLQEGLRERQARERHGAHADPVSLRACSKSLHTRPSASFEPMLLRKNTP
jgi:hypothetical protein